MRLSVSSVTAPILFTKRFPQYLYETTHHHAVVRKVMATAIIAIGLGFLLLRMKLGTRGSELALWQARLVRALLLQKAGVDAELVVIKTQGDRDQVATFDKMEGKGFFTKEIEDALLNHSIDIAVHSLKDLPVSIDPRLVLAAIPQRADPADVLVASRELMELKKGATVGTGSPRRRCST